MGTRERGEGHELHREQRDCNFEVQPCALSQAVICPRGPVTLRREDVSPWKSCGRKLSLVHMTTLQILDKGLLWVNCIPPKEILKS